MGEKMGKISLYRTLVVSVLLFICLSSPKVVTGEEWKAPEMTTEFARKTGYFIQMKVEKIHPAGSRYINFETKVFSTRTFSSQKPEGMKIHWDFGDGSVATAWMPGHEYSSDGPFQVVLTVQYEGQTETVKRTIKNISSKPVFPSPTVAEESGPAPQSVTLDISALAAAKSYTNVRWRSGEFGVRPVVGLKQNYLYEEPGTYKVKLYFQTADGFDLEGVYRTVTVREPVAHKPTAKINKVKSSCQPNVKERYPVHVVGSKSIFTKLKEWALRFDPQQDDLCYKRSDEKGIFHSCGLSGFDFKPILISNVAKIRKGQVEIGFRLMEFYTVTPTVNYHYETDRFTFDDEKCFGFSRFEQDVSFGEKEIIEALVSALIYSHSIRGLHPKAATYFPEQAKVEVEVAEEFQFHDLRLPKSSKIEIINGYLKSVTPSLEIISKSNIYPAGEPIRIDRDENLNFVLNIKAPENKVGENPIGSVKTENKIAKYPIGGISNVSKIFEFLRQRTDESDPGTSCSSGGPGAKECSISDVDLGSIKIKGTDVTVNEKTNAIGGENISIFGIDFPFPFIYFPGEEKVSFSEKANVGFLQLEKGTKIDLAELMKAIASEIVARQRIKNFQPSSAIFSLENLNIEAVSDTEFEFSDQKFPKGSTIGIVGGVVNKIVPPTDVKVGTDRLVGLTPIYFGEDGKIIEAVFMEKNENLPGEKKILKRYRAGREIYRVDFQTRQPIEKFEAALKAVEHLKPAGYLETKADDYVDITFYEKNWLSDYPQIVTLLTKDGKKILARPISYRIGRQGDCGGGGGIYVRYQTFFGENVGDVFLAIPGWLAEKIEISKIEFDVRKEIEDIDEFTKQHGITYGNDIQELKRHGSFYLESSGLPDWSLVYLLAGHDTTGEWVFYKKQKLFHLSSRVLTKIKIGEKTLFWGGSGDDMQSSDTLLYWNGEKWLIHVQRSTAEYCIC